MRSCVYMQSSEYSNELELNLSGNPTKRSALNVNCDLGRFINRILGGNVQDHRLNMSGLIVALGENIDELSHWKKICREYFAII